jgi:hypothetical protein
MRTAEWIQIVVFSFLTGLAVFWRMPHSRRLKAIGTGAAGLAMTFVSTQLPRRLPPLAASVWRDWLPAAMILLVYWQAGQFFVRVEEQLQRRLAALDETLVAPLLVPLAHSRAGAWVLGYLEIAYLFCYPMIPLSLGTIYLLRMGHEADRYWTVVLVATYFCYAMVPFTPMLPPRMIEERWLAGLPENPVRRLNLQILRHASIHANTFPSAHVAASISSALVLIRLEAGVGLAFLLVAVSIALGAVFGRYHYAADAILGTVVALAAFAIEVAW